MSGNLFETEMDGKFGGDLTYLTGKRENDGK
jgi:hypothetical protein